MQGTRPERIPCPECAAPVAFACHESANADLDPGLRQAVLEGRFMRADCSACGVDFVVESELLYTELRRGWFIGVFPRTRRSEADALGALIEQAYVTAAGDGAPRPIRLLAQSVRRRVVFGYDELREKVLCGEHGLDDRAIEVTKLALLLRAPGLAAHADQVPTLVDVDPAAGTLLFRLAAHEHLPVPRARYEAVASEQDRWQRDFAPLFDQLHVNITRCGPDLTRAQA